MNTYQITYPTYPNEGDEPAHRYQYFDSTSDEAAVQYAQALAKGGYLIGQDEGIFDLARLVDEEYRYIGNDEGLYLGTGPPTGLSP